MIPNHILILTHSLDTKALPNVLMCCKCPVYDRCIRHMKVSSL